MPFAMLAAAAGAAWWTWMRKGQAMTRLEKACVGLVEALCERVQTLEAEAEELRKRPTREAAESATKWLQAEVAGLRNKIEERDARIRTLEALIEGLERRAKARKK
jgi:phage shock protein A